MHPVENNPVSYIISAKAKITSAEPAMIKNAAAAKANVLPTKSEPCVLIFPSTFNCCFAL